MSGDLRGMSQPSICRIVKKISTIFAENLATYIKFPSTEAEQRRNINLFNNIAGFPNVSGCIDCTHIPIGNPGGDNAELFRNRKSFFSLNIQASFIIKFKFK